jgi:Fungal specific transcription factor domain
MRAGQALITGKYHKARPYSVEAVLLYAQCKYLQKEDPDADAWNIMGISARLAMRMGYHRDPRHFASISPFEGEMRRRTFFIVETLDLLLSFQAGLPAVIHEEECDTEPPSNLFDEDFDEDCKILPSSRPPTDPTPMLYFWCKSRFAKLLKRVIRHALSVRSYEETMKLDSELHEMHSEVPPSLQIRPLSLSFTDHSHGIEETTYCSFVS